MTDIVTYCDVNTCEDCPRYGDDCDGEEMTEHTDYISRADAIEAMRLETGKQGLLGRGDILDIISALPSVVLHNKDAISREGLLKSWEELSPRGRTEFDQVIMTIPALPLVEAKDIQTEDQARYVAKETELAHIETKLENAEKRLQGVCVANFVAEQLDRLRNMTDEERWDFFIRFFSPSADAEPKMTEEVREALMRLTMCAREECGMCKYKDKCGFEFQYNISTENMNTILEALSADAVQGEWVDVENEPYCECSVCGSYIDNLDDDYAFCPRCGARMKGGAE